MSETFVLTISDDESVPTREALDLAKDLESFVRDWVQFQHRVHCRAGDAPKVALEAQLVRND